MKIVLFGVTHVLPDNVHVCVCYRPNYSLEVDLCVRKGSTTPSWYILSLRGEPFYTVYCQDGIPPGNDCNIRVNPQHTILKRGEEEDYDTEDYDEEEDE